MHTLFTGHKERKREREKREKEGGGEGERVSVCEKEGERVTSGNTKGGSITVPLTSCLTGLESAV